MKMTREEAEHVGGQIFLSGSHKLGIREPGADIDTICVAPNFCSKQLFFTVLKDKIVSHPLVTNFQAVEDARVRDYSNSHVYAYSLTYFIHFLIRFLLCRLSLIMCQSICYLLVYQKILFPKI